MNEEELKAKILLPFLQQVGVSPAELSLEKAFKIRIGRGQLKVSSKEQRSGRLDILCTRNGHNMFVIELKSPEHDLTEDDRDQGISYARLLDEMAPLVLVTNGAVSVLYDTITRQEITDFQDFWRDTDGAQKPRVDADQIRLRYEALKHFIGLSSENLAIFCQIQQSEQMAMLKGSGRQNKKYIPELYVSRDPAVAEFDSFLQSDNKDVFAIVGESGCGKTNLVCSLAERAAELHLSLFFNGLTLYQGLWGAITDEFNWFFSAKNDRFEIIRQLGGLLGGNRKVCLFIDAIDEAPDEQFWAELDDVIRRVRSGPFKVVISCKDTKWSDFLSNKGTPTFLAENLRRQDHSENQGAPGLHLGQFTDKELQEAEEKYRLIYGLSRGMDAALREKCRLPFMLRVVSEVYQDGGNLQHGITSQELIGRWLQRKFDKIGQQATIAFLASIGKAFLSKAGVGEKVSEFQLGEFLNVAQTEALQYELIANGVLTGAKDSAGRRNIGFYYPQVKDYVIAIYTLQLDTIPAQEFGAQLPELLETPSGQSAVLWYYRTTNNLEHRNIFEEESVARALDFLTEYVSLVERHFPAIKDRFPPYSTDRQGLVFSHHGGSLIDYAFRTVIEGERPVITVEDLFDLHHLDRRQLRVRGNTVRTARNFLSMKPGQFARQLVGEMIQDVLKKGRLDESQNYDLAVEKTLVIIEQWAETMLPSRRREEQVKLPIRIVEVEKMLQLDYARDNYYKMLTEQKRRENPGSSIIMVVSTEMEEISRRAHEAIGRGEHFIRPAPHSKVPWKALEDAIAVISRRSGVISERLLPERDQPGGRSWSSEYSDGQAAKYIEKFLAIFYKEYEILVAHNFPTLKERFGLYGELPVWFIGELVGSEEDGSRGVQFLQLSHRTENHVEIHVRDNAGSPTSLEDRETIKVRLEDRVEEFKHSEMQWGMMSCSNFFHSSASVPIGADPRHSDEGSSARTVIRNMIYQQMRKELEGIKSSELP